ncbi:major facilitator superfamily domain-containing protein [Talaromyces proteolyticus]|uniref:Major facilitator superfamily domain-containing protein n=1 Tax=Talaromyces proteolyticus TaxID=1131652 RepID=A0AAD4KZ39_9EURO|nr:major facilitator superfamily domain-containing protein [Talaromyces proteolyticus]KAH8700721.1 major facilitator superfamily domain-containing protein [Talaromyces proteolyticus]
MSHSHTATIELNSLENNDTNLTNDANDANPPPPPGSWGVLQTALLTSSLTTGSPSTLSFVGSLSLALCVAMMLPSVRLSHLLGARYSMLLGVLLMSLGSLCSSFTTTTIPGLFGTAGVSFGLGSAIAFTLCNTLPVQYFHSKLGTANGLIKLGGGIGSTTLVLVLQYAIDHVGVAWTFRIFGLISLASGIPAALLVKEHSPSSSPSTILDFSLFKSLPFTMLFIAGSIGTFTLFVPPFFLPLFAQSIGLSASVGAAIVAGFNGCTALGRFSAGFACDRFGALNTLLLTMAVNAGSMLAIWPVSSRLAPLVVFAALNGIANGAFFVAMPTAVGYTYPSKAAVAMAMSISGWTGGYLMGTPIAGKLIAGDGKGGVAPYRAAIFISGGLATVAAIFVVLARVSVDGRLRRTV